MESSSVKIIRALNNPVRRVILRMICEDTYSVSELADKLSASKVDYKSRDSLYKHAELLVDAGLLDKFYDVRKKAISYKNPVLQVVIDLENWVVQTVEEEKERVTIGSAVNKSDQSVTTY